MRCLFARWKIETREIYIWTNTNTQRQKHNKGNGQADTRCQWYYQQLNWVYSNGKRRNSYRNGGKQVATTLIRTQVSPCYAFPASNLEPSAPHMSIFDQAGVGMVMVSRQVWYCTYIIWRHMGSAPVPSGFGCRYALIHERRWWSRVEQTMGSVQGLVYAVNVLACNFSVKKVL